MPRPFVTVGQVQQAQPIVDRDGRPLAWFTRWLNDSLSNIVEAVNQIAEIPAIRAELEAAIAEARDAADAAQAAANGAQGAANETRREQALVNSYIEPASVITASSTTITVASHTRYYADGTSVEVDGGTAAATGAGDVDYVFYDDPTRAGGDVTYLVDTSRPVQTGNRHVVGAVTIPGTGQPDNDGGTGPRPPGYVEPAPLP